MATLLHISADYPDPLAPGKTRAVSNLLPLVAEHNHLVYSINRVGWRNGIAALSFDDASGQGHRAVTYGAPPKGLWMTRFLDRLADWIAVDLADRGLVPDIVHAHKLSIEGLIGWRLAQAWNVPLMVSIQGNSDTRIIGAKRDLRGRYSRIWHGATVVFPFAPWAADQLSDILGPRSGIVQNLPCPGFADTLLVPEMAAPVIRTAFHLGAFDNKNVIRLMTALGQAARRVPEISLEILGGGDPAAFARLRLLAERLAPRRVRFLGAVPNDQVGRLFHTACGFALVSKRESFGMVFSEALLAGAPCLGPRGRAIDGYLTEADGMLVADPGDTAAIADGLQRLVQDQSVLKARLNATGQCGGLAFLQRPAIAQAYRSGLSRALSQKHGGV